MKKEFWLGNYARPEEAGVLRCAWDPDRGLEVLSRFTGFLNPSFLILHPRRPVLYTVEETAEGAVCAWDLQTGAPVLLSRFPSGGADPCHLALSPDARWLYAANYTGGSAACFALDEAGRITARTDLVQHEGHGPRADRQEKAHVHFAYPCGSRVLFCDLGQDLIFVYRNEEGRLREEARLSAPAGQGPRHLAVSPVFPDLLYCVTELAGTVLTFRGSLEGGYTLIGERSTLPEGDFPGNTAAAIHLSPDGRTLMVSHRGLDSIAVLPLDAEGLPGEPVLSPCVRIPRDFLPIGGEDVLVASQQDGVLQAYRLRNARLTPLPWRLESPSPVCLQPVLSAPV